MVDIIAEADLLNVSLEKSRSPGREKGDNPAWPRCKLLSSSTGPLARPVCDSRVAEALACGHDVNRTKRISHLRYFSKQGFSRRACCDASTNEQSSCGTSIRLAPAPLHGERGANRSAALRPSLIPRALAAARASLVLWLICSRSCCLSLFSHAVSRDRH